MNRNLGCLIALLFAVMVTANLNAQNQTSDEDPLDQIRSATSHLSKGQKFLLEYKYKRGDVFRYQSEHVLTKTTSMAKFTDKLSSRSQNVKKYRVEAIDSLGQITFFHINEKTKTETRLNDKEPVIFDSDSKEAPPEDYRKVAQTIGAILFTYRIKKNGTIIERKSHFKDWDLGTGKAIMPFPTKPVPVGYTWYVHDAVTAKRVDRRVQQIKLRRRHRLESVKDGMATISIRTEILTPITPKLRSQILQDLIEGERVFDITNGRFVRSDIRWNHRINGFEGRDSLTEYLGRYTERLITEDEKKTTTAPVYRVAQQLEIKTIDGKPIMRRPK